MCVGVASIPHFEEVNITSKVIINRLVLISQLHKKGVNKQC